MSGRVGVLLVTLAVTAGLVLVQGTTAFAGRPQDFIDHSIGITCDDPPITNGFGAAGMGAQTDDQFGPNAYVNYWAAPADPKIAVPTLTGSTFQDVTATPSHLEATIPLVDDQQVDRGIATVIADLVATGPVGPAPTAGRFKNGNQGVRDLSTLQPLQVTIGSLTLPDGVSFNLSGCQGAIIDTHIVFTDPNALVQHFRGLSVQCSVQTTSGDLALDVEVNDAGTFTEMFFDNASGAFFGDSDGVTLTTRRLAGSVELFGGPGLEDLGAATLDATLTAGAGFSYELRTPNQTEKNIGRLYTVSGTATIPTSPPAVFQLSSCLAMDVRQSILDSNPSGQKAGGKAPANDTPAGATLVRPGTTLNVQTGGASSSSEADVSCTFQGSPVSAGYTLWYRLVGTGAPVTVDSAGSNFDTVVAAYTKSGDTFTEVVCDDDVPQQPVGRSLQGSITFPTEAGVTYYVQAGGVLQDSAFQPWGRLRLRIS